MLSDKMKTRNTIILSGIALLLIAMINSNVALADKEPVGAGPEKSLNVYFLKKSFDFCDGGAIDGGSVPIGSGDIQTMGCADTWKAWKIGQDRENSYAFTGEQIAELVVARDLSGADAIDHAILKVGSGEVAYCTPLSTDAVNSLLAGQTWRGHKVDDLLKEYPLQTSNAAGPGFKSDYDKVFECVLTVTDAMSGSDTITVEVTDSVNGLANSDTLMTQTWFFNPTVSLDISMSSGSAIEFGAGYAGDTVYSTNTLILQNAAEGGVDIAVWLGGTDLSSPDMAAKCPTSNVLDVENTMSFRCTLDNGIYIEQCWQPVKNPNVKEECEKVSYGVKEHECLSLEPLFAQENTPNCNDDVGHNNILVNGHMAECMFKLTYPVPCIGEFTDGNLIVLMRAI